jgi:DNA (cytosine-5)-methyltransferase 1
MEGQLEYAGFFDGIGGFSITAEQVGWNVNFHTEIDPFCDRILKYYWPNVKNYGNINTTDFSIWRGKLDVLAGGFPCQPFSGAGNRKGTLDNRYLWPAMLNGIATIRPTWVVAENVAGIFSMEDKSGVWKEVFFRVDSKNVARLQEVDRYEAVYTRQKKMLLDSIAQDLEKIGYAVQIYSVPAAGVGAIHKRQRVWIVAHSNGTVPGSELGTDLGTKGKVRGQKKGHVPRELFGHGTDSHTKGERTGRLRNPKEETGPQKSDILSGGQCGISRKERDASNSNSKGLQRGEFHGAPYTEGTERPRNCQKKPHRPTSQLHQIAHKLEYPTQSPVCGPDDGIPGELDGITVSHWRRESIKGYGNAIVPHCALPFFEAIDAIERQKFNNY